MKTSKAMRSHSDFILHPFLYGLIEALLLNPVTMEYFRDSTALTKGNYLGCRTSRVDYFYLGKE